MSNVSPSDFKRKIKSLIFGCSEIRWLHLGYLYVALAMTIAQLNRNWMLADEIVAAKKSPAFPQLLDPDYWTAYLTLRKKKC